MKIRWYICKFNVYFLIFDKAGEGKMILGFIINIALRENRRGIKMSKKWSIYETLTIFDTF